MQSLTTELTLFIGMNLRLLFLHQNLPLLPLFKQNRNLSQQYRLWPCCCFEFSYLSVPTTTISCASNFSATSSTPTNFHPTSFNNYVTTSSNVMTEPCT